MTTKSLTMLVAAAALAGCATINDNPLMSTKNFTINGKTLLVSVPRTGHVLTGTTSGQMTKVTCEENANNILAAETKKDFQLTAAKIEGAVRANKAAKTDVNTLAMADSIYSSAEVFRYTATQCQRTSTPVSQEKYSAVETMLGTYEAIAGRVRKTMAP